MRRNGKRYVLVAVIAVAAGVCTFAFWPRDIGAKPAVPPPPTPPPLAAETPAPSAAPAGDPPASRPADAPPAADAPASSQPASAPSMSAAAAAEKLKQGMDALTKNDLISARNLLSAAYFSGALDKTTTDDLRTRLAELADFTIFSGKVYDGDPYAVAYTFKAGDVLQRVERSLSLHVPPPLLARINGTKDGRDIRAGQTVKLIQGPFHAIVSKSTFTMDIFLQDGDKPRVFVKTIRVGLGKDGSTPVGMWHVGLGKKLVHAPWNPPASSGKSGTILWGQAGYPLGRDGYWIGLEGDDDATKLESGYGIHGTNEPDSIGKDASLGCIRLGDDDITLVFSLLYEKWSTVQTKP